MPRIVKLPIRPVGPNQLPSPRVSLEQKCRIGGVAVAWAALENSINDLIWIIGGKELASARLDTQNLDITKLLSALQTAVSTKLPGDALKSERQAITNLIQFVSRTKDERNLVIHGSWGELDGIPVAGSLRSPTDDPSLVTFEDFPQSRMESIERYAKDAVRNVVAIIVRLESLR